MALTIYTAAQAATVAQCDRSIIDGACATGALRAADNTPASSKRSWRIEESDLLDWHRRGRPTELPETVRRTA